MTNLLELDTIPPTPIWETVAGRALHGERTTLAVVELAPNALVPEHRHENEQLGLVVTGTVDFTLGDERRVLGPGGMWRIPGGVPHEVRAGESGAVVVDVFAPPRDDWAAIEPDPVREPVWPA